MHVPSVTVGASQHVVAVGSAADPVIRLIDLKLKPELAEALHSLPGCVSINLECVAHNVLR